MHLVDTPLKTIIFLFFTSTCLFGIDGHISLNRYTQNEIVIFAETIKLEESVFGQVMKKSDYDDVRPFWIPAGASTELDRKTVEEFFFVEKVVPRHQAKLFNKNPNPSKEAQAIAESKDAKEKAAIIEKMKAHLNLKGLKSGSEKDDIVYYYSGRAKMKVMKVLKGGLKVGEEIEVSWDRIRMRIPCPPLRPAKGKCGWILNKSKSGDGSYILAHGFTDWDNATNTILRN